MSNMTMTEKNSAAMTKNGLDFGETDALKHALALLSVKELDNIFDIPTETDRRRQFEAPLEYISTLQQFSDRIPPYGIVYRGRPPFMNEEILSTLREEANKYRPDAWPLKSDDRSQYLYRPDTPLGNSCAEELAAGDQVHSFVEQFAGKVVHSFVTNYIYYDEAGQCSKPHVDNAFTAVTVMVAIDHHSENGNLASSSVAYWPGRDRFDYQLKPGEISIFFGVATLHGRTPICHGEKATSLLISFRPY